jgi:hypothetical protein
MLATLRLGLKGFDALEERRRAQRRGGGALPTLLRHAHQTVPFYREVLEAESATPGLERFPVIGRKQVGEVPARFMSDMYRHEADALLHVYTNQSIWTMLKVGFDLAELYEVNYGSYERFGALLTDVVDDLVPGEVGVCLILDHPESVRSTVIVIPWHAALCRRLPIGQASEHDAALVEYLAECQPAVLYGRPSCLVALADVADEMGARIRPLAVLVSGENLLLDSGEVANEGTGELLVTNLVNWCSVFIRYCIGDRGTLVHERCPCGFEGATLTDLPGKEARTFPLAHGNVESAAFEQLFASLPVKQYQVAQRTDGGLHVSWIAAPNDEPNPAAVQRAVRTLLPDVPCEITQVTRINVRSAKQRRFIRPPGPTLHQTR